MPAALLQVGRALANASLKICEVDLCAPETEIGRAIQPPEAPAFDRY